MEEKWILTENGVLIHHGIEGQKWGRRNGPPYPLSENRASSAEKKKGFKESSWAIENLKNNGKPKAIIKTKKSTRKADTSSNGEKTNPEKKSISIDKEKAKKVAKVVAIAGGITVVALGSSYAIRATQMGKNLIQNNRAASKMASVKISDLDDTDIVFATKGQTLNRVVRNSGKNVPNKNIYVSTKKSDANIYKTFLNTGKKTEKRYAMSLKAEEDLISPSARKRAQAFDNLMKNNPEFKSAWEKTYQSFSSNTRNGNHGVDSYSSFAAIFGRTDDNNNLSKVKSMYIDEIKKINPAYNSMLDDNDMGVMSKMPGIIFDSESVKISDIKPIKLSDRVVASMNTKNMNFSKDSEKLLTEEARALLKNKKR